MYSRAVPLGVGTLYFVFVAVALGTIRPQNVQRRVRAVMIRQLYFLVVMFFLIFYW